LLPPAASDVQNSWLVDHDPSIIRVMATMILESDSKFYLVRVTCLVCCQK
jgi:hypothetical protein